jgi:hypothetical protein
MGASGTPSDQKGLESDHHQDQNVDGPLDPELLRTKAATSRAVTTPATVWMSTRHRVGDEP